MSSLAGITGVHREAASFITDWEKIPALLSRWWQEFNKGLSEAPSTHLLNLVPVCKEERSCLGHSKELHRPTGTGYLQVHKITSKT